MNNVRTEVVDLTGLLRKEMGNNYTLSIGEDGNKLVCEVSMPGDAPTFIKLADLLAIQGWKLKLYKSMPFRQDEDKEIEYSFMVQAHKSIRNER